MTKNEIEETTTESVAELTTDGHIARKIRYYRQRADLTLTQLAVLLEDISFQQLQKYESGAKRVSSSRLHHIAGILAVPISNFFPRLTSDVGSALSLAEEKELQSLVMEGPFAKEVFALMSSCMQIEDHHKRKKVLDLCQQLVDNFVEFDEES